MNYSFARYTNRWVLGDFTPGTLILLNDGGWGVVIEAGTDHRGGILVRVREKATNTDRWVYSSGVSAVLTPTG